MSIKSRLKKWLEIPDGRVVLVSDVREEVAAAVKQAFSPEDSKYYFSFFHGIERTTRRHIEHIAGVEFKKSASNACDKHFEKRFEGEEFIDSVVKRIKDKQLS